MNSWVGSLSFVTVYLALTEVGQFALGAHFRLEVGAKQIADEGVPKPKSERTSNIQQIRASMGRETESMFQVNDSSTKLDECEGDCVSSCKLVDVNR